MNFSLKLDLRSFFLKVLLPSNTLSLRNVRNDDDDDYNDDIINDLTHSDLVLITSIDRIIY
jgi:hypothetical protein